MSKLPSAGPIILTVPGITDVAVAAATVGPAVRYIWPKSYVVAGFMVTLRSAVDVELANTRLRMLDDNGSELFSDGVGTETSGNSLALVGGPLTLFGGHRLRWQAFRYVVRGGERWTFQIENQNAAAAIVPWLGFRVETDVESAA